MKQCVATVLIKLQPATGFVELRCAAYYNMKLKLLTFQARVTPQAYNFSNPPQVEETEPWSGTHRDFKGMRARLDAFAQRRGKAMAAGWPGPQYYMDDCVRDLPSIETVLQRRCFKCTSLQCTIKN